MACRKKRSEWASTDEMELLQKWEARSHDLRTAKRNGHIYNEISVEMQGRFTAGEIHCKVKNLTKKYREEKSKVGPSGASPSEWKYYAEVHRIIGCTAENSALCLDAYSLNSTLISEPSPKSPLPSRTSALLSPSPSCSSRPPVSSPIESFATPRKRNYDGELIETMKEQTELFRQSLEESRLVNEEIVDAIRDHNRMSQKFLALMDKLVEKL